MSKRVKSKTFSRVANSLKEISTIDTDKGKLSFRIDSQGAIPHQQRSVKGEEETFEWIRKFVNAKDVFLDVGANIGVFSLYAALTEETRIISLEPSAETFATLNANIRLNNLNNQIEAYCLAASEKTEFSNLYMNDVSSGASHNNVGTSQNQYGAFKVSGKQSVLSITLDDLMQISGSTFPHHMKLDVDGNELKVLRGSPQVLKNIHSLLIEMEGKNLKENYSEIKHLLKNAGLEEEVSWRNKGSKRNRLFLRKLI
tara:strand:+ start:444 stop:1211 length:768 start_codon:yes stop_codon:yes gene_type:complete